MSKVFHLVDLRCQAWPLNKWFGQKTAQERLEWLSANGKVSLSKWTPREGIQAYNFESGCGRRCVFTFRGNDISIPLGG
jgi:hypothetical protein